MQFYLPIAELSVNVFVLLAMGGAVGFLSGMVGVGGGFLMTPLLIFIGVPPPVAVATGANQIIAASVSGLLAHWRRGNVDFKMGLLLLAGGVVGSSLGVWLFSLLKSLGQIDLVISLSYTLFLSVIGILMGVESVRTLLRNNRGVRRKRHVHTWMHGLPLKTRFRKSKLYISAILPVTLGLVVGVMVAIMGVGGGFIMIPAMIYILGMPTVVVVGTSLFQIIFVTANVTFLHAINTHSVDVVLALLLLLGSVVGAQFGTRLGGQLKGEQLRGILALIVVLVALKLVADLMITPDDLYSIVSLGRS